MDQPSDDELILLIRRGNEEAFETLLGRYHEISHAIIRDTIRQNRYCGLEPADLHNALLEATLLALGNYNPLKACFFSYWRVIVTRELRGFLRRYNGPSSAMVNTALSIDEGLPYEIDATWAQTVAIRERSLIDVYNAEEGLIRFAEETAGPFVPLEKAILAYRALGYSYQEIENKLHLTHRRMCRLMGEIKKKGRLLARQSE